MQRAFSPSAGELAWAVRILRGNEAAEREGRGAWTMDGKMVDAPVVGKARAVRARAEACGVILDGGNGGEEGKGDGG